MRILTSNSGSSGIKFSLGSEESLMLPGSIAGIGTTAGRFPVADPTGPSGAKRNENFRITLKR